VNVTGYYLVLAIILILAAINVASLLWVVKLQKLLKEANSKPPAPADVVTPDVVDRLRHDAEADLQSVLTKVAAAFGQQLNATTARLNQHVEEMAEKVVQDELTKYQKTFDELRQAAIERLSQIQTTVEERRGQMEADLQAEVAAEKQRLLASFDAKIGDVLSAYIVEVLGDQVDLGAQSHYLLSMLDKHKEELKKAILSQP
jgi:DNA anti-recombination protein RmuC